MRKSVVREIAKIQTWSILSISIVTMGISLMVIWFLTLNIYKERLNTINSLIEQEIVANSRDFSASRPDEAAMRAVLRPRLQGLAHAFPNDFSMGFYSRPLNRVVIGVSGEPSVKLNRVQLPPGDPTRSIWLNRKARSVLVYSGIRKAWILKNDHPIVIHGQVIGHSFANITLLRLILLIGKVALSIILLIFALTIVVYRLSNRIKKQIAMSINELVINNEAASARLNYLEFEAVAHANEHILLEKRRYERDLEHAHRRLEATLESITDAFYTLDSSWRFTYANHAVAQVFPGMDPQRMIGENIWTYVPKLGEGEFYERLIASAAEHQPIHFDVPGKYDSNRWLEVHAYPFDDGMAVYIRDVTERKAAEEALAASKQSIVDIVESITDSFFAIDRDWRFLYINKAGERLLRDDEPTDLVGRSMLEEFPGIVETTLYQHYLFAMTERKSTVFIDQYPKGHWLEIRVYPSRDGILIFSSDISDRMRMEHNLTAEKELLATVIASIGEGVVAADINGRILLMNQVAEDLTGWSMQDALGAPINNVLYVMNDKTSEPYERLIEEALSRQAPINLENVVLATQDLHEMSISLCCTPLISPVNQRQLGAIFIFEDITEKQRTEQELLKAGKLESLGILAGGIAHDFNNYLAAILSNIQLAQILSSHGQPLEEKLDQAIQATKQASDLTRQLLTFSRGGAPVKQLASIGSLIKETAKFNLHGSNVKVDFAIPDNLWNTECDPGQISQVISNMVINAKQAMPKGGRLFISAENITVDDQSPYAPGNYIKAAFVDEGVGIHESIIDKIFDPFFTTKKEGNGLGLATSFSIIKQHNGFIEVDSAPGRGTTFTIYLPALAGVSESETPAVDESSLPGGGRILLMDDEDSIREVMEETLRFLGYEVVLAKDGHTALRLYEEALRSERPFDVALLDLTVPGGMGGQDTMAYLRDLDPNIKAIVSSGYANDPVVADYESYGFSGVVHKPYKINELTEVIQALMRRK